MFIYLLVFAIVTFLAAMIKPNKKNSNIILLIAIILILSIVGGFRDFNIGTDVEVYGKSWFEIASGSSSFKSYSSLIDNSEYGYLFINYIVSRFTSDVNIFLLVLQLLSNSLVYITLYRYRDKCPLWMSSFMYLCLFYGMTFNILRQACALSILFYGVKYLDEEKSFKYLLVIILAMLFHSTAFLAGILIFLIYNVAKSKSKFQFYIFCLCILLSVIGMFFIKDILTIAYQLGIVNARIYNYIDEFAKDSFSISLIDILFKFLIVFVSIISYKSIKNDNKLGSFLLVCVISELVLYFVKYTISYSERFSFYFSYISFLYVPQVYKAFSSKAKDRLMFNVLFTVLFLGFWYYKYVRHGICEIYPYSSSILGI